jgi:two-component sensor histidine kinase
MPLLRSLERLRGATHNLPLGVRYVLAALFVLAGLVARHALTWVGWPATGFPFLLFWFSIGATAALGGGGAGYFATVLSALLCLPFVPDATAGWIRADWVLPIGVFIFSGVSITALVESLHHALGDREAALAETHSALRRRALLLTEYRHRSRGDLQQISSLLRLRARYVDDAVARSALIEAAGYATTLGAVHRHLENARHGIDEVARIDSHGFVHGVCDDLQPPVGDVFAVSQPMTTERAVSLGLLLVELVAEARRDGAGRVTVRLAVVGEDYVLDAVDDRPALGPADAFRARLTGLLAGQLRGTLTRAANHAGPGWAASLRFPVLAPVLAPGQVGT